MARAETIESVGETGGSGGNDPLPHHNSCRTEMPLPFYNWPGMLAATTITTTTGVVHLHHHHHHHHLHPLQALYLSCPLPDPHPEAQESQTHQESPALSPSPTPPRSPLCNLRESRGGSAFSGEQSDSYREEIQGASSWQGPLPDLLPQNEHLFRSSPHHRAPRGEAAQELEIRRVANQLRAIGDEYNATVLRRVRGAPHWQDWRDACRGLLNFITQMLSTLYRLT